MAYVTSHMSQRHSMIVKLNVYILFQIANVHPWFANVSIDQAAGWTYEFFQDTDVAVAQNLTNKPQMFIAETGWPSVRQCMAYS